MSDVDEPEFERRSHEAGNLISMVLAMDTNLQPEDCNMEAITLIVDRIVSKPYATEVERLKKVIAVKNADLTRVLAENRGLDTLREAVVALVSSGGDYSDYEPESLAGVRAGDYNRLVELLEKRGEL